MSDELYQDAVRMAALETDLPENAFPAHCPYSLDRTLDNQYLP